MGLLHSIFSGISAFFTGSKVIVHGKNNTAYTINRKDLIGNGKISKVYRVKSNAEIAAKEVILNNKDEVENRVRKESEIFEVLNQGPNLVKYIEHIIEGTHLWIFMEYCDLGSLPNYLKGKVESKEAVSVTQKIEIMQGIANAVSFMHLKDLVHRGLKPESILLKNEGNKPVVKVSDFGLCKRLEDYPNASKNLQYITSIVGDEAINAFQAPECFDIQDGKAKYNKSVDTFAAGLIFLVILTFERPDGTVDFLPRSVNYVTKGGKSIGMQMLLNAAKQIFDPVLPSNRNDDLQMRTLHLLINAMTACDRKQRLDMEEAKDKLNKIGFTLAYNPDNMAASTTSADINSRVDFEHLSNIINVQYRKDL